MQPKRFRDSKHLRPLQVKSANTPHSPKRISKEHDNNMLRSTVTHNIKAKNKIQGERLLFFDKTNEKTNTGLRRESILSQSESDVDDDDDDDVIKINEFSNKNRQENSLRFEDFDQPPNSTSTPAPNIDTYSSTMEPNIPLLLDRDYDNYRNPYNLQENNLMQNDPYLFRGPNTVYYQPFKNDLINSPNFNTDSPLVKKTIESQRDTERHFIAVQPLRLLPVYYSQLSFNNRIYNNIARPYAQPNIPMQDNEEIPCDLSVETAIQPQNYKSEDDSIQYDSSGGKATYHGSK